MQIPVKLEEPEEAMLDALLKSLHKILLEPVRKFVVESQIVVVPEGILALIPLAALVDETGHYVSDSLQVRLMPSLATAKLLQQRPEEPPGKSGPLVVGDPEVGKIRKGGKEFLVERLPLANQEVDIVGKLLGVEPLVGENATKKDVLKRIGRANLIHIAAHGDAQRGEILLAAPPGTNISNVKDIMLTISDLERKHLRAKLVVLSCCHSGRGKVMEGEGVVGIARAFLGAGARAVVAALWAVDDAASLCFMVRFYEFLLRGDSANEALNNSMKNMRVEFNKFRHPRLWAPYVLLGEDVTPFPKA